MNTDVFVLFNSITNREQIHVLGQKMDRGQSAELLSLYESTDTKRPHGYLVIDCSPGKANATFHDACRHLHRHGADYLSRRSGHDVSDDDPDMTSMTMMPTVTSSSPVFRPSPTFTAIVPCK